MTQHMFPAVYALQQASFPACACSAKKTNFSGANLQGAYFVSGILHTSQSGLPGISA